MTADIAHAEWELIRHGLEAQAFPRWIEVSIGQVSVVNLNAGKNQPSRHIVSQGPQRSFFRQFVLAVNGTCTGEMLP